MGLFATSKMDEAYGGEEDADEDEEDVRDVECLQVKKMHKIVLAIALSQQLTQDYQFGSCMEAEDVR